MKIRTFQIFAVLVFLIGLGQSGTAQTIVPLEKEPRHRLKFENQYVRLFDVLIPAGDTTFYHTHKSDGSSIRLSDSRILEELLNGEKVQSTLKTGEVAFAARPVRMTHRVTNNGASAFRNIFIEILPVATGQPTTSPEPLQGHEILIDNPRVTVYRLVLKPGQSTEVHTYFQNGIAVAVSYAKIQITVSGKKRKTVKLRSGDYIWHIAGTSHKIKNVGSSVFETVDVEIK